MGHGLEIANNRVGIIDYRLTDANGRVLDSSAGRGAMAYLHGHGNVIPGLEKGLEGKQAGDRFKLVVAPADGYGEKTGPGPQEVPKEAFPANVRLTKGNRFEAEGSDGKKVVLWITKVEAGRVWVDTAHPLAGKTLYFDVEVKEVREANREELEHGHAHGMHGAHH